MRSLVTLLCFNLFGLSTAILQPVVLNVDCETMLHQQCGIPFEEEEFRSKIGALLEMPKQDIRISRFSARSAVHLEVPLDAALKLEDLASSNSQFLVDDLHITSITTHSKKITMSDQIVYDVRPDNIASWILHAQNHKLKNVSLLLDGGVYNFSQTAANFTIENMHLHLLSSKHGVVSIHLGPEPFLWAFNSEIRLSGLKFESPPPRKLARSKVLLFWSSLHTDSCHFINTAIEAHNPQQILLKQTHISNPGTSSEHQVPNRALTLRSFSKLLNAEFHDSSFEGEILVMPLKAHHVLRITMQHCDVRGSLQVHDSKGGGSMDVTIVNSKLSQSHVHLVSSSGQINFTAEQSIFHSCPVRLVAETGGIKFSAVRSTFSELLDDHQAEPPSVVDVSSDRLKMVMAENVVAFRNVTSLEVPHYPLAILAFAEYSSEFLIRDTWLHALNNGHRQLLGDQTSSVGSCAIPLETAAASISARFEQPQGFELWATILGAAVGSLLNVSEGAMISAAISCIASSEDSKTPPKRCRVNQWGNWSKCACGSGISSRVRSVVQLPQDVSGISSDGTANSCPELVEYMRCNQYLEGMCSMGQSCAKHADCPSGTCLVDGKCDVLIPTPAPSTPTLRPSTSAPGPTSTPTPGPSTPTPGPLTIANATPSGESDCGVSPWSAWTTCDRSCGTGYRQRRRNFVVKDGKTVSEDCRLSIKILESASCNEVPCPLNCTAEWAPWSACSQTCGGGHRRRFVVRLKNHTRYEDRSKCPLVGTVQTVQCATFPCVSDEVTKSMASEVQLRIELSGNVERFFTNHTLQQRLKESIKEIACAESTEQCVVVITGMRRSSDDTSQKVRRSMLETPGDNHENAENENHISVDITLLSQDPAIADTFIASIQGTVGYGCFISALSNSLGPDVTVQTAIPTFVRVGVPMVETPKSVTTRNPESPSAQLMVVIIALSVCLVLTIGATFAFARKYYALLRSMNGPADTNTQKAPPRPPWTLPPRIFASMSPSPKNAAHKSAGARQQPPKPTSNMRQYTSSGGARVILDKDALNQSQKFAPAPPVRPKLESGMTSWLFARRPSTVAGANPMKQSSPNYTSKQTSTSPSPSIRLAESHVFNPIKHRNPTSASSLKPSTHGMHSMLRVQSEKKRALEAIGDATEFNLDSASVILEATAAGDAAEDVQVKITPVGQNVASESGVGEAVANDPVVGDSIDGESVTGESMIGGITDAEGQSAENGAEEVLVELSLAKDSPRRANI